MSCCIEGHRCEDCCLCGDDPVRCEINGCREKANYEDDQGRLRCVRHGDPEDD